MLRRLAQEVQDATVTGPNGEVRLPQWLSNMLADQNWSERYTFQMKLSKSHSWQRSSLVVNFQNPFPMTLDVTKHYSYSPNVLLK
jgi:hypothetical protein